MIPSELASFIKANPVQWRLRWLTLTKKWEIGLTFNDGYFEYWNDPDLDNLVKMVAKDVASGALQERRTKEISVRKAPSNSKKVDKKVRWEGKK